MMKILVPTLLALLSFNLSYAEPLSPSIAKQLQLKISRIAIDPGFGGNETGPTGCREKIHAKDINLQIAKKVAEKIKKNIGIDVILTRDGDKFVSLEERAAIANTFNADLLLSIHSNASEYSSANGIETYCLNIVTDHEAIAIAAQEAAQDFKSIADLDMIISELMQNASLHESGELADIMQRHVVEQLEVSNYQVKNRGVKQAPFYIFIAAEMPSAMIQTGFITNPIECERLRSLQYQEVISEGIVAGIEAYIQDRDAHKK